MAYYTVHLLRSQFLSNLSEGRIISLRPEWISLNMKKKNYNLSILNIDLYLLAVDQLVQQFLCGFFRYIKPFVKVHVKATKKLPACILFNVMAYLYHFRLSFNRSTCPFNVLFIDNAGLIAGLINLNRPYSRKWNPHSSTSSSTSHMLFLLKPVTLLITWSL